MAFLQLNLDIGAADPEPLEDALLAAGALSITLQDAADDPVLEPLPGTTPLWPSVRLQALFDEHTDRAALRQALEDALGGRAGGPLPALAFEILADRAWEREWLKDFHPMRFGRRLWICPGGQRPPPHQAASACLIELDPGLAFGTGTHPTTALCLEWLDGAALAQQRVIDYGCGSGVLAIAALKLGARTAVAIDIDPQALLATRDNALRNAVDDRLVVQLADAALPAPADILLANILAEPLDALAEMFARLLVPGGRLVLSGLLREQTAAIARRYEPWFEIASPTVRGSIVREPTTGEPITGEPSVGEPIARGSNVPADGHRHAGTAEIFWARLDGIRREDP